MPRLKLTDWAIPKIKDPPKPKQEDHWDLLVPAFGMRASYNGSRSWLTMVRILKNGKWKQTRVTFGRYPAMSLAEARDKAREIQKEAQSGSDPVNTILDKKTSEVVEASKNTFAAVRDRYIRQYCKKNLKPKTASEYERALTVDFKAWEERPISAITKAEVNEILDAAVEAGTPIKANRMLSYLSAMMNWAASKDIIQIPPTMHVRAPHSEKSRDRSLSETEIKILWQVLNGEPIFGGLMKFLLLTGQRREEVAQMRWSELDLDSDQPMWEIPRERVKMDRPHRVPLSPLAVDILNRVPRVGDKFTFTTTGNSGMSGFSRAKTRIDNAIARLVAAEGLNGVFQKPWVIHDLRRTCATEMAELGASRDVVELILNHRSGSRSGVAAIYNRSELLSERRIALNNWADQLTQLVASPIKKGTAGRFRNRLHTNQVLMA